MNNLKPILRIIGLIFVVITFLCLGVGHPGIGIWFSCFAVITNVGLDLHTFHTKNTPKVVSTFIVIDNGRYSGTFCSTKTAWMDIAREFHNQVVLPRTQVGYAKAKNNAIQISSRTINFSLEPFPREFGMTTTDIKYMTFDEYMTLTRNEQEEVYLKWARRVEVIG